MPFDLISIVLGIIVVVIFAAIYTLLRTMTSPFIKRFESILKIRFFSLKNKPNSYAMCFQIYDRDFELYELSWEKGEGHSRVYNNYLFMLVRTNSPLRICFQDVLSNQPLGHLLMEAITENSQDRTQKEEEVFLDTLYRDFRITSNNVEKAREFLQMPVVHQHLTQLYEPSRGNRQYVLPLFFEPGSITLDYRFSSRYLNQLIQDPRSIRHHIALLSVLAREIEKVRA